MKTQHTPGPWRVCGPSPLAPWQFNVRANHAKGKDALLFLGQSFFAEGFEPDAAECEANARLIAAAPELLAACRDVQSYFDALAEMQPERNRGAEFKRIREVVQGVIAKAKGNMTHENIKAGKLYQVYRDETPDDILFEGSKAACSKWVRKNLGWPSWRNGSVRIGRLLWDGGPKEYKAPCLGDRKP